MALIESGKKFDKNSHQKNMKSRMQNMDYHQYPLRIPKNIFKKAKVKAAQEGVTLKFVLLQMIDEYLKK